MIFEFEDTFIAEKYNSVSAKSDFFNFNIILLFD